MAFVGRKQVGVETLGRFLAGNPDPPGLLTCIGARSPLSHLIKLLGQFKRTRIGEAFHDSVVLHQQGGAAVQREVGGRDGPCCEGLVQRVRDEKASVERVVIRRRLLLMQYNILCRMMFDTRPFAQADHPVEHREDHAFAKSFQFNYGEFMPILKPFLRGYLERCRELQCRRLIFFNKYLHKKNLSKIKALNGDKHNINCAIDHMLEAEKNGEINEKNVIHIVENINVAIELVNHPNVQSKLQDEISNILEGNPLTESDLDRLPYLQAVVKETLGLHTLVPLLLPHMNLEDAELNGYTIPKESKVVVNAWWLANNPAWWKKPEEFRPEQFLEEEGGTDDVRGGRVDFKAFGVGRRSCPGIILALPILGIVIGKLVMNFELCPPEGMEKINVSETGGLFSLRITNHSTVAFQPLKVCSN
ncbi:cinnamate 4-hydroxylase 1 [Cinnamomum micranthum f. kanehirae]|uniref:Cinnamate 4-hydroxylase 1 n=1 Tax=Cinnamomum micranthum f. kanehirae TaxID=337451 RepID=A0A443PYS4_9MAGN|nr:cinnamate 4-hydroxylase 1 [Cinnamomum micranthum f. kanehirae]